jgi:hypothetical protein
LRPLQVESEVYRANCHDIARAKNYRLIDSAPIDERAVGATEIFDHIAVAESAEPSVLARYRLIVNRKIARVETPHHGSAA